MSTLNRKIKYSLAINEALIQSMRENEDVFIIGQGVKSPWYVGQTTQDLVDLFGESRVIDTPVSENAVTGAAVGAALTGMRPVVVHPRMDFMLYAMDPIINQAANWYYMNGGKQSVPVVIWGVINRGGEQGAQHSQALHTLFAHIPGLKVVMPATPYDAKGLMISAINDNNPVVFIDDRWLHCKEDIVPEEMYSIPIGKANVLRKGNDLTIISASYMTSLAQIASKELDAQGIQVELIDLRSIKPIDTETIVTSIKKTECALILDPGWRSYGMAAEITSIIQEETFTYLKKPVKRICLPDVPAPASRSLEAIYFPTVNNIVLECNKILEKNLPNQLKLASTVS